ncbi:MAG: hypothetical protein KC635_16705 [Myxococcales bacterium]|nr:hypothetical protein [Myxococcales bacterium]MCB9735150.1 hypothetical protein [Deltaproteobacteria bacterium]
MSVALPIPASPPPRAPFPSRPGDFVVVMGRAADGGASFARDAARDAFRLDGPAFAAANEPAHAVDAEVLETSWHHRALTPLPTSAFLAMRDMTRHLRR